MARLRVSAQAARDLDDIAVRGAEQYGIEASIAFIEGFRRLFGLLRDQPLAGQARPEFESGIRSLSLRPYRIFYRFDGELVRIERIIHHSRDATRTLRGDR